MRIVSSSASFQWIRAGGSPKPAISSDHPHQEKEAPSSETMGIGLLLEPRRRDPSAQPAEGRVASSCRRLERCSHQALHGGGFGCSSLMPISLLDIRAQPPSSSRRNRSLKATILAQCSASQRSELRVGMKLWSPLGSSAAVPAARACRPAPAPACQSYPAPPSGSRWASARRPGAKCVAALAYRAGGRDYPGTGYPARWPR